MKGRPYPTVADNSYLNFPFTSIGKKGRIKKVIIFTLIAEDLYNLALCDIDPITGEPDDMVVCDNGDIDKVFDTVAATVVKFCNKFRNARVIIRGNTDVKKRLYRMRVSSGLAPISRRFDVYGFREGDGWTSYQSGGKYELIMIQRVKSRR